MDWKLVVSDTLLSGIYFPPPVCTTKNNQLAAVCCMSSLPGSYNILIVEDNPADQFLLEEMLMSCRLKINKIYTISRLSEAKNILYQFRIDCVLLDLSLPDSFGMDSLDSLREITQQIPIIILTGLSDTDLALKAINRDAQDYLVKGEFNANLLVKSIEYSFERKKIEEKIRSSEEKYRQMFYKNPYPMWVNDQTNLQVLEVNDAALHTYGYSREEFLALRVNDLIIIPDPALFSLTCQSLQEERQEHQKKNGAAIIVDFTYFPINHYGRTAMLAQVNDVTEKVLLQEELNLQKQKMLEAVLNAQENERQVIGRELHDNINQILTAVKLSLDLAQENQEQSGILISKSIKSVSMVMQEIRKLTKELIIPGNIKELGIVNAIKDLLKEMLKLRQIEWHFAAEGLKENSIPDEHKLNIFRIVQEQLTNIVKHAAASFVLMQLTVTADQVYLKIMDNGNGFDPAKKREGVGITNITSRAEMFDGNVKINSAPGNGCTMEIVLKINRIKMTNSTTG